ncbi:MAG TPA: nucleotidyltransferase domain-containing protein [Thermomicrobiales bacterium]|nr:nucleotidyltransferase domain-containing protein [Thermomicrobiales bacterium]
MIFTLLLDPAHHLNCFSKSAPRRNHRVYRRMADIPLPLEAIRDICRRYHVRKFSLFGSALRDDFGSESDFDFLVEFESGARIGFMELGAMEQELEALLGRHVDLVPKGLLLPIVREEVLATAHVLYAA